MKKGLIIFALLLPIILVLWFYIHVNNHSQDIPPIDDSDLLWVQPVIPATNNAFYVFTNAAQVLCLSEKNDDDLYTYLWDEEASQESKKAARQEIASLIESNRLFFALVSEGLQRDHCFIEDSIGVARSTMDLMKMNAMMLAKIKILTEAGEVDEALETAMASLRLGELLERDAQDAFVAKMGIEVISRSIACIDKITGGGAVSSDREEKLLKQLDKLKKLRTGLENSIKAHYSFLVNEIIGSELGVGLATPTIHIPKKLICKDYVLKQNATRKVLSEHWRDQIDRLKHPEKKIWEHLDMSEYQMPQGLIEKIRFALSENSLGKSLIELCTQSSVVVSDAEEAYKTEEEVLALEKKLLSRQRVNE
jgi:phage FluMu protein gp41